MPSLTGLRMTLKATSFFAGDRDERLVTCHFQAKTGFNIYRISLQLVAPEEGNSTMIRSGRHARVDGQSQGPE